MELPCALVLTIFGICFRAIDGNSVSLTPSPLAIALEGELLNLQCDYSGSFTLLTVNWYLNGEHFGLVISADDCRFLSTPSVYEIVRYHTQCNPPSFSLLITNITKDQDDNDLWECDTTPLATHPPSKVSTRIKVLEQKLCVRKPKEGSVSGARYVRDTSATTTTTTTFTASLRMAAPAEETGTSIIVGFRASFVFILLMIVTMIIIICLCCYLYHNWNEERKQTDRSKLEKSNTQPPEIHTASKQTNTSVLRRALHNLGGGLDDKPIPLPELPPPENSDVNDQILQGLANFDETQGLTRKEENYSEEPKKEK